MVQSLGKVGSFTTAALIYTGAAVVAVALKKRPPAHGVGIHKSDSPRLLVIASTGAVFGRAALVR